MAGKSDAQLREELQTERAALTDAVGDLRGAIGRTATVAGKVRSRLPFVAVGLGFLKAGGLGATVRLLRRRGRR